jgi:hypothetical protein
MWTVACEAGGGVGGISPRPAPLGSHVGVGPVTLPVGWENKTTNVVPPYAYVAFDL